MMMIIHASSHSVFVTGNRNERGEDNARYAMGDYSPHYPLPCLYYSASNPEGHWYLTIFPQRNGPMYE